MNFTSYVISRSITSKKSGTANDYIVSHDLVRCSVLSFLLMISTRVDIDRYKMMEKTTRVMRAPKTVACSCFHLNDRSVSYFPKVKN